MKSLFSAVGSMQRALAFHRDRHSLLSGNVANVDTPGYRPVDIERKAPEGSAQGLRTTRAGHLAGPNAIDGNTTVKTFDDGGDLVSPDGNAVTLERELAKIDANRVRYNTTSELVSRRLAVLKYAATDGNG